MNLLLDANDLSALTMAQKAAIVDAMCLVIAIDRKVEPAEIEKFNATAHQIPWGMDGSVVDMAIERARERIKCTLDKLHWQAWIKEIAQTLPDPVLREKVLATISQLALDAGQTDDTERGLLNAFAGAFELAPERLAAIREQVVAHRLSPPTT